jgi:hypothetical protein
VAIMMQMQWDGVTPEQYEELRKLVNWEGDQPPGAIAHVSAFTDKGIRVTDIWDSADDFDAFLQGRLMPGVGNVGVAGEPHVEILPAHAVFIPGVTD